MGSSPAVMDVDRVARLLFPAGANQELRASAPRAAREPSACGGRSPAAGRARGYLPAEIGRPYDARAARLSGDRQRAGAQVPGPISYCTPRPDLLLHRLRRLWCVGLQLLDRGLDPEPSIRSSRLA